MALLTADLLVPVHLVCVPPTRDMQLCALDACCCAADDVRLLNHRKTDSLSAFGPDIAVLYLLVMLHSSIAF